MKKFFFLSLSTNWINAQWRTNVFNDSVKAVCDQGKAQCSFEVD